MPNPNPPATPPYIPQIRLYQHWLRDARGAQAPLQAALPYLCGLVVLGAVCTAAVLFATRPRNVIAKAV